MAKIVLTFAILLLCLSCPPVDAIPRLFYCFKMCRLRLIGCIEKTQSGRVTDALTDHVKAMTCPRSNGSRTPAGRQSFRDCSFLSSLQITFARGSVSAPPRSRVDRPDTWFPPQPAAARVPIPAPGDALG
ncbi:hypothetical protein LSAT2_019770 [Lamellibrachia satsuma]|nr:hypothetical protein LSAT2_019770 [Lamellibrachia satsuma]